MEIKDLAGLSEPMTRLVDVVSKGVGTLFTPYVIKKTAEARAYQIKTIANAFNVVAEKNHLPIVYKDGVIEIWQKPEDKTLTLESSTIEQRAIERVNYQERKRQHNVENVTSVAAAELLNEASIPHEQPGDDWIARFFSNAQDVSSHEMQELWGKILAGEIKKPGSYSLRTLDFIRNITKNEAEVLEKVGRLALWGGNSYFVAVPDKEWLKKEKDIQDSDHFLLSELGIMYPTDLALSMAFAEFPEQCLLGDEYLLLIKRGEIRSTISLPIWKFTGIGVELLPLIQKPFDEQYFDNIGKMFLAHKAELFIGKVIDSKSKDEISYQIVRKIEPTKTQI